METPHFKAPICYCHEQVTIQFKAPIYELPYAIFTDNDTQFKAHTYENFLTRLGIKHPVTSIKHPQTNDQAEVANKIILRILRTRLDKSN